MSKQKCHDLAHANATLEQENAAMDAARRKKDKLFTPIDVALSGIRSEADTIISLYRPTTWARKCAIKIVHLARECERLIDEAQQ